MNIDFNWTGLLIYFGGIWFLSDQGRSFWQCLVWPWYVGRYIAANFTLFN